MKCKCGTEMFEKDKVDRKFRTEDEKYGPFGWFTQTSVYLASETFRCPKCYKTKKLKLDILLGVS